MTPIYFRPPTRAELAERRAATEPAERAAFEAQFIRVYYHEFNAADEAALCQRARHAFLRSRLQNKPPSFWWVPEGYGHRGATPFTVEQDDDAGLILRIFNEKGFVMRTGRTRAADEALVVSSGFQKTRAAPKPTVVAPADDEAKPPALPRAVATRCAAAVVARWVPDLPGLCLLLTDAGLGRLSAALRAQGGEKRGVPRERGAPDAGLWAEAARRMVER